MTKGQLSLVIALSTWGCFQPSALAAFSNYNTILIGERSAGMGGAYTALSGDPAACSFYNPATLARMEGSSLSASVSVYNKYDTQFGDNQDFYSAPLRVNQGAFDPVPTSSGSVHTFRNFAFGLSIVIPDSTTYNGEVRSEGGNISLLNLSDESLWVGGTIALNLDESMAAGMTVYYTSRVFSRSVTDRIDAGGPVVVNNEEKTLTNNSLIYQLGLWRQLSNRWQVGLNHRFSSMEISGHGTYYSSVVSTAGSDSEVNENGILSETKVPAKTSVGFAYLGANKETLSVDVSYHDRERYHDLSFSDGGDLIVHKPTWNLNIGGEYYLKSWLALRAGIYSNLSSAPDIPGSVNRRLQNHIDMWGWSANLAIYTSSMSSLTLGGYYTGGKGHSTQLINGDIEKIPIGFQTFTLLVGTTFRL